MCCINIQKREREKRKVSRERKKEKEKEDESQNQAWSLIIPISSTPIFIFPKLLVGSSSHLLKVRLEPLWDFFIFSVGSKSNHCSDFTRSARGISLGSIDFLRALKIALAVDLRIEVLLACVSFNVEGTRGLIFCKKKESRYTGWFYYLHTNYFEY